MSTSTISLLFVIFTSLPTLQLHSFRGAGDNTFEMDALHLKRRKLQELEEEINQVLADIATLEEEPPQLDPELHYEGIRCSF